MFLLDYLKLIRANFPSLTWQSVKFIDKGWTNDIVILDKTIVFRFPKEEFAKKNFQNELALLHSIAGHINLQIPHYSYLPKDMSFGGYKIINGSELKKTHVRQFPKEIAKNIGIFLSQLHSIPLDEIKGVEKEISTHYTLNDGYIRYILDKFTKVERQLNKDLYRKSIEFIEKSHPLDLKNLSLTHYDFQGKNIIFSQKIGNISGVIDFSDSAIYDPAIDFSNLFVYGIKFVEEVLKNYDKEDAGILERAYFFRKQNFIFSLPDLFEKSSEKLASYEKQLFDYIS